MTADEKNNRPGQQARGRPRIRQLERPIAFMAGEIEADLLARSDPPDRRTASQTAQRDLARYYAAVRRTLGRTAMTTFTEAQASILVDVGNGTLWEPHSVTLLYANVEDAAEEGMAAKWGLSDVEYAAFVRRLHALSYVECLAVCDACERFWSGPYHREVPLVEGLRAVGLVAAADGEKEKRV